MPTIERTNTQLIVSTLATANGNLFANYATNNVNGLVNAQNFSGFMYLCIQKTGAGTITMTPQGSFDGGVTFYAVGFAPIENATITRTITALSVTGGAFNHTYQILDRYPFYQFALSAISGANSVGAYLYYSPL
jgi:hypothetical protein